MRKSGTWLKTLLVQCAWAAVRKKGTYLSAQFHQIAGRQGAKKAIMAVAGSMLTAIYHMLQTGEAFNDLGAEYLQRRSIANQTKRLTKRLANLGYKVEITPIQRTEPMADSRKNVATRRCELTANATIHLLRVGGTPVTN